MLKKDMKIVIGFCTTTEAMAMEAACKAAGMPGRLIPIPREITAGCGLAWAAPVSEKEKLLVFMKEQNLSCQPVTELCLP